MPSVPARTGAALIGIAGRRWSSASSRSPASSPASTARCGRRAMPIDPPARDGVRRLVIAAVVVEASPFAAAPARSWASPSAPWALLIIQNGRDPGARVEPPPGSRASMASSSCAGHRRGRARHPEGSGVARGHCRTKQAVIERFTGAPARASWGPRGDRLSSSYSVAVVPELRRISTSRWPSPGMSSAGVPIMLPMVLLISAREIDLSSGERRRGAGPASCSGVAVQAGLPDRRRRGGGKRWRRARWRALQRRCSSRCWGAALPCRHARHDGDVPRGIGYVILRAALGQRLSRQLHRFRHRQCRQRADPWTFVPFLVLLPCS